MVYKNSTNPSKYIGVSLKVGTGRWRAKLSKHGKVYIDRTFLTELEAAVAYDRCSLYNFGDEPNKELIKNAIQETKF